MNFPKHILTILLAGTALLLGSCGVKIADAEYPEQMIYLPAAVQGTVYAIDSPEESAGFTPTEGAPYKFVVDYDEGTFSIPLSVCRSGINDNGSISVSVYMDDDLVDDLIISGELEGVESLPADMRDCPLRVVIEDGKSNASFEVVADLYWLMDLPQRNKVFAFGVSIESHDRKVNESCSRVVVTIDTRIFDSL